MRPARRRTRRPRGLKKPQGYQAGARLCRAQHFLIVRLVARQGSASPGLRPPWTLVERCHAAERLDPSAFGTGDPVAKSGDGLTLDLVVRRAVENFAAVGGGAPTTMKALMRKSCFENLGTLSYSSDDNKKICTPDMKKR